MKDTKTSERYAQGFLDAFQPKDLQELLLEVRVLLEILQTNSDIMKILSSHNVKNEEKVTILEPFIANTNFDEYWQNLMMLLAEKGRFNL